MLNLEILNRIIALLGTREQKELTDFLHLKKTAFSDWKSSKSNSYRKYLIEISEFFNVSLDYLVYGKETSINKLTPNEQELLNNYNKLSNESKKEALRRTWELTIQNATSSQEKVVVSKSSDSYESRMLKSFRTLSSEAKLELTIMAELMEEMSKAEENVG